MTTPERMKELMEHTTAQRVVCAALRIDIDKVICSPRHCDQTFHAIIGLLPQEERDEWYHGEQGFVDQFGKFLTRQEAWIVAERAGQIIRRCGGDGVKLFSENLY